VSLTAQIRGKAGELGFNLFGVTPADPLAGAEFYARWVALGFAGEMDYLKRNLGKRADPRQLVPDARAVICLGMDYTPPPTAPPSGDDPARIASYALGDDYHELIKSRLRQLWGWICNQTGGERSGRYYVDTAPVLERELAQRAGLGWWGKNTCLINRDRGSYFFLAEIILDLELEFDQPATDHCGTCTRCLEACPTDAFPKPYVLDASRCISYLTIELKGPIPNPLRPLMQDWVFGCDICQQVCPWNGGAPTTSEPALQPRDSLRDPHLLELMALDPAAFRDRFRNNPVKRPKRAGFLRNVAVALGNRKKVDATPVLTTALDDDEPLIRAHAAWALGQIGGEAGRTALNKALTTEQEEVVRAEIESALLELEANASEDRTGIAS